VFAADQACYDHVGFSSLLNADTTVDAWVNKAFTVATDHAPIFGWQSQFGSHGDFPRNLRITLRQLGFLSNLFLSQTKESVNALQRYPSSFIHFCSFPFPTW